MAQKKSCSEETLNMLNMSDFPNTSHRQSEIPQFFANCNVLITGASGFVGTLLIEKILR